MRLHVLVQGDGWADDLTAYASGLSWEHGPSGPRALTMPVPLTLRRAARLYDAQGAPPRVTVRRGPRTVWAGRVDRAALAISRDGTTLTLRATGGAAALRDIRHTALWSSTRVAAWEPMLEAYNAAYADGAYTFDTNNRLYIAPEKGSTVGNTGSDKRGGLWFGAPHRGSRGIVAFSANYTLVAGAGWTVDVLTYNVDYTTTPYSFAFWDAAFITSTAGSGTINLTFTAVNAVVVSLRYNAADVALTGIETGDVALTLTNVRVKTTTGSVTAGVVAQALLSEITAANPGQLSTSTALIQDPGLDLTDLVYEDAYALPVLQGLAAKGDGAGTIYECGVDNQRRLFFRPRGSAGRQWFISLSDLRLERPRDSVESRVYARYQDAGNRVLRTASVTNATSVARYGLIRDGVVDADTTSTTQAQQIRDTYAADVADPLPAARFGIRSIQRAGGAVVPGDEVLPGDQVTVLGLPGRLAGLDRVRTFRVGESGYDAEEGPTLTPEEPLPSLEVLLAQQGRALEL